MEKILSRIKSNKKLMDIFSVKEEYDKIYEDTHGRFPFIFSKNKDIFKPIVSDYLVKNGLIDLEYPEKKKFAICLTHDIDSIYQPKLKMTKEFVKFLSSLEFRKSLKILSGFLNKKSSPLRNFEKIIEIEKKYAAKSTFFFTSINKWDFEFNYRIEDLKNDIRYIIDNGFEVGLHGGYDTFNNIERMKQEKNRLEDITSKEVLGFRNHYLRFKIPETWELLKNVGFEYDTTLGYHNFVGFKNGMCHPFKPYNLKKENFIDIFEIPLNIMDETLFVHIALNYDSAWKLVKRLIDETEKYKGVLTFLWHNTNFYGEMLEFYERILAYSKEKNAWITSCEEIWKFFIKSFI